MLSKKESQLGVTMARIAAIGTIVIFGIQAILVGPDQYIWSYSEKDDGVYYFWVNIFPSKESRDAWTENYDAEAEQEKMSALIKEKTGFSSEELDEDKELDLSLQGMDIQLQN